ncbi:MAG: DegT/DnrJ/EryC1/StrS family aminotransferase [Geobacter sp.]|nr:DegT/DnrJ/EryC1/StrS family aminotransferase [Geobacter sp.]
MNDPVKYWDYLPEYRLHKTEILSLVDAVFSSGRLILGSRVASFEANFSAYCGAKFGIGVNSCTDALFLSLKAIGAAAGDEVITVSNTAVPTVAAIRAAGATPVFADVEADSYLMDTTWLENLISPRTRCIIPVHLCGQCADMDHLMEIADRHGIAVIEDCAQAAGAAFGGCKAGSFGVAGAFSFYPTKILGAYGDGGMVVTSSEEIAAKLRRLRFYGMEKSYYSEEEGYNSRLDEVQAAILDLRLPALQAETDRRRVIAKAYDAGLAGVTEIKLPAIKPGRIHQYYLYTIRAERRDDLQQYLAAHDIESRINYPTPIHLMQGYNVLGYREGSLPVTERLAGEILSLPMYGALPEDHLTRVIAAIKQFYSGKQAA